MKKLILVPTLLTASFLVSCGSSESNKSADENKTLEEQSGKPGASLPESVVDIALSTPNFSTLVSFLQAANLVETLKKAKDITVFAPTNEAFAKIPSEVVEKLKANPELLKQVLLYHVAPSNLDASKVTTSQSVATLQGEELKVSLKEGSAFLNDSKITAVDVFAKNGTVHVIDTVLVPNEVLKAISAPTQSLFDIAQQAGSFKVLLQAAEIAGLTDALKGPGAFTVFAPTDEAFNKLGPVLQDVVKDKPLLTSILTYHILDGVKLAKDVLAATSFVTLNGKSIMIDASSAKINRSQIIKTDLVGTNGVIHVIDTVLLPE